MLAMKAGAVIFSLANGPPRQPCLPDPAGQPTAAANQTYTLLKPLTEQQHNKQLHTCD